jgi:hypothetical protein
MPKNSIPWKSLLNPDRVTIFHSHHGLVLNITMARELAVTPEGIASAEALAKKDAAAVAAAKPAAAAHAVAAAVAQEKEPVKIAESVDGSAQAHQENFSLIGAPAAGIDTGAAGIAADVFILEDLTAMGTFKVVEPTAAAAPRQLQVKELKEAVVETAGAADATSEPELGGTTAAVESKEQEPSIATDAAETAGETAAEATGADSADEEAAGKGTAEPEASSALPPVLDNGVRFMDKQCAYLLHFVNLFKSRRGVEDAEHVSSNWKDLEPGVQACEADYNQHL